MSGLSPQITPARAPAAVLLTTTWFPPPSNQAKLFHLWALPLIEATSRSMTGRCSLPERYILKLLPFHWMYLMCRTKLIISSRYLLQFFFLWAKIGDLSPVSTALQLPSCCTWKHTQACTSLQQSTRTNHLRLVGLLVCSFSHLLHLCHALSSAPTQSCLDVTCSCLQMTDVAFGRVIFHRVCHSWHCFLRWQLWTPRCSASPPHILRRAHSSPCPASPSPDLP